MSRDMDRSGNPCYKIVSGFRIVLCQSNTGQTWVGMASSQSCDRICRLSSMEFRHRMNHPGKSPYRRKTRQSRICYLGQFRSVTASIKFEMPALTFLLRRSNHRVCSQRRLR